MSQLLSPEQLAAADRYNAEPLGQLSVSEFSQLTAQWQRANGLSVDGKYGPLTEGSVKGSMAGAPSQSWDGGPLKAIPRNRREVYQVYGNPGTSKVDRAWKRENIVHAVGLPGTWAGNGRYCHQLAEPYFREALRRCEKIGVVTYITRIGGFVFRHQRHDPSRPLSYHSWGIAFDINASDNSPRTLAGDPEPWSAEWMRLWPDGVPRGLVESFESVGFSWGGRWRRWADPMHFELVA